MADPLRVLVVEDSEEDTLLIVLELRRGDYEPTYQRVDSAEGFIETLDNEPWDCVIADYSMPQFGGLEALRLLRESGKDLPFIVVSGAIGEDIAVAAMKAGAHDYVMKDNLARLVPAVRRELREAETRRARERSARLLQALNRAASAMENALTPEEIFDAVAHQFRQIGIYCVLFLVDAGAGQCFPQYLSFDDEAVAAARDLLGLERTDVSISVDAVELCASLVLERRAVFVEDPEGVIGQILPESTAEVGNQVLEVLGVHKSINVPLIMDGEASAFLSVGSADMLEDDVPAIIAFAHQMAAAWRKAQLLAQARQEIADRRRVEEGLKQRNRELTALAEVGSDIAATLDLQTVLERIARHARDLLEADESEVYLLQQDGRSLKAVVALGDWADQYTAVTRQAGEGLVGYVAERGEAEIIQETANDPRVFWVPGVPRDNSALLAVPLVYQDEVLGVMAVARLRHNVVARGSFGPADVDFAVALAQQAAVAMENARLFAAEQEYAAQLGRALEQQRELAHLQTDFVQNVSHELRTPLALIQGYAELLEAGELGQLDAGQQKSVAVIARRVRMLSKLVDDLTTILEIEQQESQCEFVNLSDLVQDLLIDFEVAADGAGLTLAAEIGPDLPVVIGDATHLRRVLDNLLGNALKFTPEGGNITVRLGLDDGGLVLQVQDTGVGIPQDQADRVFERFFQVNGSTSRLHGGAGLGLALVKQIVEAHGGTVAVASSVGTGSTFIVTLPAASRDEQAQEE